MLLLVWYNMTFLPNPSYFIVGAAHPNSLILIVYSVSDADLYVSCVVVSRLQLLVKLTLDLREPGRAVVFVIYSPCDNADLDELLIVRILSGDSAYQ